MAPSPKESPGEIVESPVPAHGNARSLVDRNLETETDEHSCVEPLLLKKADMCKSLLDRTLSRRYRSYLEEQISLVNDFLMLHSNGSSMGAEGDQRCDDGAESQAASSECGWVIFKTSAQVASLSLWANICLLILKIFGSVFSGSLSVISTLIDSALDLFASLVFYFVGRTMKKRSTGKYPVGKRRLEPLAVIFVASVMGTAAVEIVIISVQSMLSDPPVPTADAVTISIVAVVVAVKFFLYLVCRLIHTPSAQALAADHINDVVSNSVALVALILANKVSVYFDGSGAILVSIFIVVNWSMEGLGHVRNLAGHVAPRHLLQQVTWIALHHNDNIISVDTVRGFGFGNENIVEVDIVLPETMTLHETHDISESLQIRLEELEGVERAYVHADYATDHKASDEHNDIYTASVGGVHSTTLMYDRQRTHGTTAISTSEEQVTLV